MNKSITLFKKEDTIKLGYLIGKNSFSGSLVLLKGDLGAGKTTLVGGCQNYLSLGKTKEVSSPTFNILKVYFNNSLNLYHIDAYRLEDCKGEIKNIGLEEVIDGDGVCLIEWPQFVKEFYNENDALIVELNTKENDIRECNISSLNNKWKNLFLDIEKEFK